MSLMRIVTYLLLSAALPLFHLFAQKAPDKTGDQPTMSRQFHGKRVNLKRDLTIEATPDVIFPLLCPVREEEWVHGWVGKAIFSESGVAEVNGVFASEHGGEDDTIWFVTKRDMATHEIEFVYFVPKIQVVRLFIRVTPVSAQKSTLSINYLRTGISEPGNEAIDDSRAHFDKMMAEWEATMNHYIRTGTMLEDKH